MVQKSERRIIQDVITAKLVGLLSDVALTRHIRLQNSKLGMAGFVMGRLNPLGGMMGGYISL